MAELTANDIEQLEKAKVKRLRKQAKRVKDQKKEG